MIDKKRLRVVSAHAARQGLELFGGRGQELLGGLTSRRPRTHLLASAY
jgi:hypothetical protein